MLIAIFRKVQNANLVTLSLRSKIRSINKTKSSLITSFKN